MSSFYDDASLVMIPSCYKVGTVLCEKPTDGSGDLTFTRTGDTATRIAPNGLLEKVRTNRYLYSEQIDNAIWSKIKGSVTANSTTAPDGTLTADTFTEDTTSGTHDLRQGLSSTGGVPYFFSIYVKANGRNDLDVFVGGANVSASFDLVSGTVTGGSAPIKTIVNAGNGWWRVGVGCVALTSITTAIWILNNGTTQSYTGDGVSGVYYWGAQAETGDIATDYIPTTTAAVSVGPLANVPRLDYLGSSCPRLLLEPQRTNSILWSEQINKWGPTNTTVTTNVLFSPDGYQNADTIVINDSTSRVSQNLSLGAGTYTASVYAKLTSGSGTVRINLIVDSVNSSFTFTPTNEWERYTYTVTAATGITAIQLRGASGTPTVSFWGAQLELGSYATSYIPTLGAAVTRGADSCSKTGISSLIGQTEGTLFAEFEINANNTNGFNRVLAVGDGTANNRIFIFAQDTEVFRFYVANGGAAQVDIVSTTSILGGRHKVAFAYKANDFIAYVDGVEVGTDTSGTIPSCSNVYIGSHESGSIQPLEGGVNQVLLFKTRLTNAELAELTTL
jgi:hypothetical protein